MTRNESSQSMETDDQKMTEITKKLVKKEVEIVYNYIPHVQEEIGKQACQKRNGNGKSPKVNF